MEKDELKKDDLEKEKITKKIKSQTENIIILSENARTTIILEK